MKSRQRRVLEGAKIPLSVKEAYWLQPLYNEDVTYSMGAWSGYFTKSAQKGLIGRYKEGNQYLYYTFGTKFPPDREAKVKELIYKLPREDRGGALWDLFTSPAEKAKQHKDALEEARRRYQEYKEDAAQATPISTVEALALSNEELAPEWLPWEGEINRLRKEIKEGKLEVGRTPKGRIVKRYLGGVWF